MKKRKIEIIDKELTPTTLAIRKDNKKVSIFGIVWIAIIFGVFIAGVIYLPDISSYVNNYFNPEIYIPSGDSTKSDVNKDDEEKEEVIVYNIGKNPEVVLDNLKINNVVVNNSLISFNITNTSSEIIKLEDYNYFMNIYDENKKLIERIMFDKEVLSPSASLTLSYNLREASAFAFSVLSISKDDYPAYVAKMDENKTGELVCSKEYETITYLLNDNKVYAITIYDEVLSSNPNFNTLYSTYQAQAITYNSYEGVSSSVDLTSSKLAFRTIINLSSLGSNFNLKTVYPNKTDAKIMHFELTASGYTCN